MKAKRYAKFVQYLNQGGNLLQYLKPNCGGILTLTKGGLLARAGDCERLAQRFHAESNFLEGIAISVPGGECVWHEFSISELKNRVGESVQELDELQQR